LNKIIFQFSPDNNMFWQNSPFLIKTNKKNFTFNLK